MAELRPHQKDAIKRLHNGSILCGGVGSGKSMTAIGYYIENEAPKDVYVITTAKKRNSLDWDGEAAKFGVGRTPETTVAGVLHVDSWNNIGKYKEIKDAFFIFDEQRVVGSGSWADVFIKIARNNRWILLSATPGDTWLDYIPVFVANGFYKNRTQFKREHVVYNTYAKFPKVDRYLGVQKLVKLKNQILVDMPMERHTTRHLVDVEVSFDEELMKKVVKERWHVYENRPLRDVAELFSVMRKVVNSDESRITTLGTVLQSHPKVIVFYNFDYELEILRNLADIKFLGSESKTTGARFTPSAEGVGSESIPTSSVSMPSTSTKTGGTCAITTSKDSAPTDTVNLSMENVQIAEWNGHKHEEIPDSDRWIYLVQYVAGAEGWNCIETNCVVFWSLTYSYKNFEQAQGRIDRMNTPYFDLWYYTFRSKSAIDAAIWKALKVKKSFNEREFARKTGLKA